MWRALHGRDGLRAIATGVVNGLKLGYNAQAAIINRGINEIMRVAAVRAVA